MQGNRYAEKTACRPEEEVSHGILYKFSCGYGQHDVSGHEPDGIKYPIQKGISIITHMPVNQNVCNTGND